MQVFLHLFARAFADLGTTVALAAPLLAAFFGAAAVLAKPAGAWLGPVEAGAAGLALAAPDALALAILLGLHRSERRLLLEGTYRALALLPCAGRLARCAAPLALLPFLLWQARAAADWAPFGSRLLWSAAARGLPPEGEVARREIPRLLARTWGLGAAYLPPEPGAGTGARILFFQPESAGRYLAGGAELRSWRAGAAGLRIELTELSIARGRWPAPPEGSPARAGHLVLSWRTAFGHPGGVVPPALLPESLLGSAGTRTQATAADPDPAAAVRRLADLARERRRRRNRWSALWIAAGLILAAQGRDRGALGAGLGYLLVRGPLAARCPPLLPALGALCLLLWRILRSTRP